MGSISLDVVIEQKTAEMTPYVVVPAAKVARWKLAVTVTIEVALGGVAMGRRSLKRWDDARWFVELPRRILSKAGLGPGDRVELRMTPVSGQLPDELVRLIEDSAAARACWEAHTEAERRMLREHIYAAKSSGARTRRAQKTLLPAPKPRAPQVVGLAGRPREIQVHIIATRFPGRTCGPYSEIVVGLVERVGCDPNEAVAADAREARWRTIAEVRQEGGEIRFRGKAVNGPPHERFLYLTWVGRLAGAAPAMFRRAKLRLDAVPAPVIARALRSGVLVGRVGLTAGDGMPLCASVRPPLIEWDSRA